MKHTFVIATLLVMLQSSLAYTQWSILSNAIKESNGNAISVIYFLDKQGKPNTGFVAGESIFRTTDGGLNWKRVIQFNSINTVLSISFADSLNGWAAGSGNDAPEFGRMFKTTDGGLTWSTVTTAPTKIYNAVHAISRTQIVASLARDSGIVSTDGGSSWTRTGIYRGSGFTFSDSAHGMVGNFYTLFNHYTADAGRTWKNVFEMPYSWQPLAIEGTSIMFVSPWTGRSDSLIFLRSDNNGQTFIAAYDSAVTLYLKSSGQMGGYLSRLYFASPADVSGIPEVGYYRSTDEGLSWCNICGPSMAWGTRWYSKGDTIITWDSLNNIWINPTGTADIEGVSITPGVIAIQGKECESIRTRIIIEGDCVRDVTAEILGISGTSMNIMVRGGKTAGFRALYTIIDLHVSEPPVGIDSGFLHLRLSNVHNTIDTLIPIRLEIEPQLLEKITPSAVNDRIMFCDDVQSKIQLLSECGGYTVKEIVVDDTGLIALDISKVLPAVITEKDTLLIALREPGSHKDTIKTFITVVLTKDTITRTVIIPVTIVRNGTPSVSGNLKTTFNTICRSLDTIIHIRNLTCDSILITSLTGSDSIYAISVLGSLPDALEKNGILAIRITSTFSRSGTYSGHIYLKYVFRGQEYDTLIQIQVNVTNTVASRLSLSASSVAFKADPPCLPREWKLLLWTTGCDTISIDSVDLSGDEEFDIDLSIPLEVTPDADGTVRVLFHPTEGKASQGVLTIYYTISGISYDTTIALSGIGTEDGTARLADQHLDFGQRSTCEAATLTTFVHSLSCDTVQLSVIKPFTNVGYSLGTVVPILRVSDSIPVIVTFASKNVGTFNDQCLLVAESATGRRDTLMLSVSGTTVNGPLDVLHAANVDAGEVSICATFDTTITIANSACDTMTIESLSLTGDADFVSVTTQLPLKLAPGETADVQISVNPQSEGLRNALLMLAMKNESHTRNDTILLSVFITPATKQLTSNQKILDFGTRSVCDYPDTTITLTNPGCTSVEIFNAWIEGRGFIFDTTLFPMTLGPGETRTLTITTVPDTADGNTASAATLMLQYDVTPGKEAVIIPLNRSYILPRTYTLALDTIPSTDNFVRMALRITGDIVGLQSVSLAMLYNTDLLQHVQTETSNTLINASATNITLSGSPALVIAPDGTIATLVFQPYVTKDSATDIVVQDIQLNSGDTLYERCIASAVATTSNFSYHYVCNERLLSQYLRTNAITLNSIVPNPTDGNVTVNFVTPEKGQMHIEVYDALGRQVRSEVITATEGTNSYELELPESMTGMFTLRLALGHQVVTGRFVKE